MQCVAARIEMMFSLRKMGVGECQVAQAFAFFILSAQPGMGLCYAAGQQVSRENKGYGITLSMEW